MKAPMKFQEWSKETLKLAGLRPGTIECETPLPGMLMVVLRRPSVDVRQLNLVIQDRESARELLSGIALAFPDLM